MLSDIDRFMAKVQPDEKGCWLWTGALFQGNGYGQFKSRALGRSQQAHRAAYEMFAGPIPLGLEIDHLCRVRLCVNPTHLEAVTTAENARRRAATITHCRQGHPFDEGNTFRGQGGKGQRRCKQCMTTRHREYMRRRPGLNALYKRRQAQKAAS